MRSMTENRPCSGDKLIRGIRYQIMKTWPKIPRNGGKSLPMRPVKAIPKLPGPFR